MIRFRHRHFQDTASKSVGLGGKLGMSLFFFCFFAMGSFFEIITIREFAQATAQRSWQETPCKIVDSKVEERSGSESPYTFAVRYEYQVGGRTLTGTAYKRGYRGSEKYSNVQTLVEKYPSGRNASCFVNPKDPAEVVLRRDSLLTGLVILFPLIFVVIGAGGFYFIWRKQPAPEAKPIAASIAHSGAKAKYGLVAFFAIFAIAGLAMLYPLGIRPIAKTLDARSWVEVPCRVLRSEVRSHDSDDGTTYSIYILYSYDYDGCMYKADRYDFVGGSSSGYRGKARVAAEYEAMPNPVCYVNPRHPSEAVLKRGFHAKLLLALFPLPFIAVGFGGMVYTWRGKIGGRKRRKPWMPKDSRVPARDDLAVLRQAATGPVMLEPRYSPLKKLIAVLLAAVFWNGIISFMVFRGGVSGGWFSLLFSLPFIAVGLGLLIAVVYQFFALFNPRPTLELSSTTIPLGQAAELGWRFAGRVQRIRTFTVTLRGVESATYRRGTRTCTDTHTFYEMELYKTSDPANAASGQVGLVLPQETMHSFEADNNSVIWRLEVRGDIRKWPDVKETFPITVAPVLVD